VKVSNGSGFKSTSATSPLTFAIADQPDHGSVQITPTGNQTANAVYTPAPGYVGSDTFSVTATDERALASAPAAIGVAVGVTAPSATAAPTVSGSAHEGATLTSSPGAWAGTEPIATATQWQRCDAAVTTCADVPGATGTAYVAGANDVGSTLRVLVTASGPGGTAAAFSAPTGVVGASATLPGPPPPPPPGAPASPGSEPAPQAAALQHGKAGAARGLHVSGSARGDVLVGTPRRDVIWGRAGNDRIRALGGADVVRAGPGDDVVRGGAGGDMLEGGLGDDRLLARDGTSDRVVCGPGDDVAIVDAIDSVGASCEAVRRAGSNA
jgi:Ca2+-binding RTX toxin-like protein